MAYDHNNPHVGDRVAKRYGSSNLGRAGRIVDVYTSPWTYFTNVSVMYDGDDKATIEIPTALEAI